MGEGAAIVPLPGAAKQVVPPRARPLRQFELVERVKEYDPNADEALINRAYVFGLKMHGGQKRHNGDDYFAHPIEVAGILTEYKLDAGTIIAGLLHDTVEDTVATTQQITEQFGPAIAELVEGVTKLSELDLSKEQNNAANLQRFLLATAKDVRVLLVKLADRLHNMRTLAFVPNQESRKRIANETLDIYAPLARRIGMDKMSTELEELAFAEAYPDAYHAISARLARLKTERGANVAHIKATIATKLRDAGVEAKLEGREKQPYSIWRKLERKKHVQFNELADIYAVRVIVKEPDECYKALGLIHQTWRAVPEAFEDYVSNPKPNGYRSIHTTVVGPGNVRVEIQIRTEEMDRIAELGVAAHWRYKNRSYGFDAEASASTGLDAREAVQSLLDIVDHGGDAGEFLEHTKLDMYQDHVFAFTPKGKLIALPQGATPLDFAYAVHSDIGDRCIGAKISGEERPLRTALRNGDVVVILTSDRPAPVPGWASLTKTGRARSAQRRLERLVRRAEFERLGRDLIAHALARYGRDIKDTALADAARKLGQESENELFAAVGEGKVRAHAVAAAAFPGLGEKLKIKDEREPIEQTKARLYVQGGHLTAGGALHFAECCSPIPGDRIVGVQIEGQGVMIHTIDCERLASLDDDEADWIDLAWTDAAREHALAVGRILATVENVRGALAHLCKIIADHQGNILDIHTTRRAQDFFDMRFDVEVADVKHLTNIIAAMRTSKAVREVERVRG
jgi:GTP diphosphokinase / guanosine-3',5'-bis(diphosphate) 3'-diphosphatase